ncbi:MAG: hypothetical protein ACF8Q5_09305 [Phycisphaerales bacterium JB040]
MGNDRDKATEQIKKPVEAEIKKSVGKLKKPLQKYEKLEKEAKPILKKKQRERTPDEVKKLDLMEEAKKAAQRVMLQEATSLEARLNRVLKTMPPPDKKEQIKLPLPRWLDGSKIKISKDLSIGGDVDFKKKKFMLKLDGKFMNP